jgi:hypothetical protein
VLFGAYKQTSGASFIGTLPEILWEASLGIYLIARGFKPSASTSADTRQTAVGEGPLSPAVVPT